MTHERNSPSKDNLRFKVTECHLTSAMICSAPNEHSPKVDGGLETMETGRRLMGAVSLAGLTRRGSMTQ